MTKNNIPSYSIQGPLRKVWVCCENCGKDEQRETRGYIRVDYCGDCEKRSTLNFEGGAIAFMAAKR